MLLLLHLCQQQMLRRQRCEGSSGVPAPAFLLLSPKRFRCSAELQQKNLTPGTSNVMVTGKVVPSGTEISLTSTTCIPSLESLHEPLSGFLFLNVLNCCFVLFEIALNSTVTALPLASVAA